MKSFFFMLAVTFATTYGRAQNGNINIKQDQKIAELLDIYKSANSDTEYYTIQVGFGSSSKAEKIKSEVEIDFPELPARTVFDSPTFRVRVGRFKKKLDAERKFIEVREKYPDAMLLKPKKSTK
ncbi:SPOR domain-containing protein [Maribacter algicola]|uniref:SPOR domain-containing protein n=1 Tax=Meishania litoralis TaxID=3434685 RepID=A0ACC7LGU2_9FLAO